MKRFIIFSIFIFSLGTLSASAQDKAERLKKQEVPENVYGSFNQLYPYVNKPVWVKSEGNYEAEFVVDFKTVTAKFNAEGKWLNSEFSYNKQEIEGFPSAIASYIDKNYKDADIEAASLQLNPSGKLFIVSLDPDDSRKTDNEVSLYFAENGRYLKQESID